MQVNESGIFHAERYSNLLRTILLRRIKAFFSLQKYSQYLLRHAAREQSRSLSNSRDRKSFSGRTESSEFQKQVLPCDVPSPADEPAPELFHAACQ
jgi:hypothetical protein